MISGYAKVKQKFSDISLLRDTLEILKSHYVKVGVLRGTGTHGTSKTNTAAVAAYNEFGTSSIPERSFMRPAFRDLAHHRRVISESVPKLIFVKDGNRLRKNPRVKAFFAVFGMSMVSEIQKKIRSNIPPANAESTKARKGPNKTSTLIDTGAMLQAINYKVERNK
jgi:hypothetical protein